MTRDEAQALIEQHEGQRPASLDVFLEYVGMSEAEFMEIAMSHQVSPYAASTRRPCRPRQAVCRTSEAWDGRSWERRSVIAIVDYGMGNLRSVAKALEAIGEDAAHHVVAGRICAPPRI